VLESTGVRTIEVRVRKPRAPLPGPFDSVEVTVRRPRSVSPPGREASPG
jgi:dihydroneopterin aldolase